MALISRKLLHARPQELGKIKIGGLGKEITSKKGNKFQPPLKFDHFVITTRVRGDDGNFIRDDQIHAHPDVGDHPTSLAGVLMYERPDENFHSEMAHYQGRSKNGKVSSCDGETLLLLNSGERKPCYSANGGKCPCKPYGRLHLQLWASPFTMGYHVFRTTSWESTNNIQSALEEIYSRLGTCLGAPVRLVLYPSEDRREDGVSISHKVGLVLAMSLEDTARQIAGARQYAVIASGGAQLRQLAAGVREDLEKQDEEEAEMIAQEFFPEMTDREVHATVVANALHAEDPKETTVPGEDPEWPDEEENEAATEKVTAPTQQWKSYADADPLSGPAETVAAPAPAAASSRSAPRLAPPADRIKQANAKYFAMLAERGMSAEEDRRVFQVRLVKEGKMTSASCTDWDLQDYRGAIAELEAIPATADDAPENDDDLFGEG